MKTSSRCPGRPVLLDDLGARDVGGHEVGRELHALELELQRARQAADEQRLGQARHARQDAVPPGEQGHDELVDDRVLAHDDLAQLGADAVVARFQLLGGGDVVDLVHSGLHDRSAAGKESIGAGTHGLDRYH
jgi:hypothetical protein